MQRLRWAVCASLGRLGATGDAGPHALPQVLSLFRADAEGHVARDEYFRVHRDMVSALLPKASDEDAAQWAQVCPAAPLPERSLLPACAHTHGLACGLR